MPRGLACCDSIARMHFIYLRDRPDLAPLVAQWIWDEWHHLLVQKTLPQFAAWFRGGERGSGLPTTLVLLVDEEPAGTVSLECDDMDIRSDLTPWLASLYVTPARRGLGYGQALVRRAEAEARTLGIEELFLYTPGQAEFYAALGWQLVETCSYRDAPVTIMARALSLAARPA